MQQNSSRTGTELNCNEGREAGTAGAKWHLTSYSLSQKPLSAFMAPTPPSHKRATCLGPNVGPRWNQKKLNYRTALTKTT